MSWLITPQTKVPVDPYRSQVSLLLHGDGANGSTTITDSSPSPKTVTAVGNAQISTAQSKPGFGGSSILLGGAGNNLSVTDSDSFYLPADFTIECHLYAVSWVGEGNIVYFMGQYPVADYAPIVPYFNNGSPGIAASSNQTSFDIIVASSGAAIPLTSWTHVAWTRSGNRWSVWVNGTERVLSASAIGTPYNAAAPLLVGRTVFAGAPGTYPFNGYIDDLRITKGVARYTANFTPPTAPFPDI